MHIKLTPQRLAILSYLNGNTSHPSAEDIYKAVQGQFPTMSFATVYNTLEALKNKGSVQELKIDHAKKRYDPDSTIHHHLICNKCKNIIDIHKDFNLSLPDEMTEGFDVLGNSIEFYGVCSKCNK
ncbi:MAG TPA: transcriptional repressor [Nitrospirae bacterium]|nr:transcriptional repressor [Nitrospirota bacterium]HDZ83735.1 transcriptional repressor [Nitrospirota bacterium]